MHPVRRSARRVGVFLGMMVLGIGGAVAAAEAQEELLQELKTVARVHMVGRHHLSAGAIRKVTKTRGRSMWPWRDRPVLRFDYLRADVEAIKQLYRHYGYLDANASYQVVSSTNSDVVDVRFVIVEGLRSEIESVRFEGVASYPERDLRRRVWSRPERAFDPAFLQLDTLIVSTLYQERGYRPHVRGEYQRHGDDSTRVSVVYRVEEGERYRIGEVTVSGHDKVKDRLIHRELLLRPGLVYQLSRVQRSSERLYETGMFSQVLIDPLPDSTHTVMNFDVRLRERRPRWIDAGIGSGTDERFRLIGGWGHRNIAGQGLQALLSSRLTFTPADEKFAVFQRWHVEGSLIEPWLLGIRARGSITPFYERYDDRADERWVVRQEFKGVNFSVRRELNRFARLTLTQENLIARQEVSIFPEAFQDSATAPTPAELDSLSKVAEPDYTTHRLSLAFERDIRDNPFSATRGSTARAVAEVAGGPLRGTSSFQKYEIGATWYTPLPNGWVLATRAAAGVIDPYGPRPTFSPVDSSLGVVVDDEVGRVPLEDRFRAGGVNSIRGHDENSIPASGGLALIQGSVELRIPTPIRVPFLGTLGIEAYIDAGNVWTRPEHIGWDDLESSTDADPDVVRVVGGVGPRIDLPVGPLRVDVTWRWRPEPSPPKIQVAIGPSF